MSWKYYNKDKISAAKSYQVIVRNLMTEKSMGKGEYNQYGFEVMRSASKDEIRGAVEEIFKVKVLKVNTMIRKGKEVRFRGRKGKKKSRKLAYVTLEAGQSINFEGVK